MSDTGVVSRRSQRASQPTKGDRQERALLDVGSRLLEAGTAASVSVSEIADAAGISRASFYFYFSSKQALFASVVDETVSLFNERITDVAGQEYDDPASAVRATIEFAAQLWWDHAAVMISSVELGTTMPDLYARTMQNIAIVRAPTVALLQRYGTVPESSDEVAAAELVTSLIMLCERSFYDLMRGTPAPADRDRLTDRLAAIWLRSFGIRESS